MATSSPYNRRRGREANRRGLLGEAEAELWLRQQGWQIIATRMRNEAGEIDLIARQADTIAFVEVKSRRSVGDGRAALSAAQASRLQAAAEIWIAEQADTLTDIQHYRFDLIELATNQPPRRIENILGQY
ncbi:MAG: YraN family protein [Alphaproteobacteria bacterium]